MWYLRRMAVVLGAAVLATGCAFSRDQGEGQVLESAREDSPILKLSLDAEVSTLDPQAAVDSTSFEVIGCTMEGLYGMDGQGKPYLLAAESVKKSEDGLSFTFLLRENQWSDGKPVTAEDFVYGWRRAADPGLGNENAFMMSVGGIKNADQVLAGELPAEDLGIHAAGERKLVVELDRPVPYFESLMAFPTFYPFSKGFFSECKGNYGTSPETLISNGPFVVTGYEPAAAQITLVKNENYWNQASVAVKEIRYQVIKDSQQALMAYESGGLDVAVLSGSQAELLKDSSEYRTVLLGSLWYVSPNQCVGGLDNENLRKALTLAFDREKITEGIMKDGSIPMVSPVPLLAEGGREDVKRAESSPHLNPAEYWEQAKKELGIDSLELRFLVEDTELASNMGQFLQAQFQTALPGLTIRLEPVPKKVRLDRMQEGDYDLALVRWGADYNDPTAFLGMWTSDSPYNYGSWSNEEYDKILNSVEQGTLAADTAERSQALLEAEQMIVDHAVVFPICQKSNAMLIKPGISGIGFHMTGVNRVFRDVEFQYTD